MMGFIARLFGRDRTNPYGQYAGLVAQSLAASRACFNSYELAPETRSLDPSTASLDDCVRAYRDCKHCTGTEYPETELGSDFAFDLIPKIEAAVLERFPASCPPPERRLNRSWVQDINI